MWEKSVSLSCAHDSALDFMCVVPPPCVFAWPHDVKQKDCVVSKHRKETVLKKLDRAKLKEQCQLTSAILNVYK